MHEKIVKYVKQFDKYSQKFNTKKKNYVVINLHLKKYKTWKNKFTIFKIWWKTMKC